MKKLMLPSLFIVFLVSLAPAVLADGPTSVCRWEGNVSIGGTLTSGNQTGNTTHIVEARTNSTLLTRGTTYDSNDPRYIINVPGNSSSSNITFYVCGIYDANAGEQTWSCGAPGYHILNLQMTYRVSGAACTYDCTCNQSAGLHCASDYDGVGSWCVATSSCMHDGSSTANAGTVCSSTTVKQTCTSGAWVATTCTYGCSGGVCSSAPTGGTGGGGGGTAEVSESIAVGTAAAGETVTATYTKSDDIKIQEIEVELKNAVTNAYIQVKESSLPSGANLAIETTAGATYKYLEVTKTHMTDDDISKATVTFKVARSWITGNSIDKSTVALNRYDSASSSWTRYSSTITSEDSSYVYYTAELPGLSVLAITGEKVEGAVACTAGAKTCVGNDLQQCKTDGSAWETLETCAYGCDSTAKACKSPPTPCTAGAKRCDGDNLQQCKSDGSAWETLEACTYGCDSTSLACKSAPTPACVAGSKRCMENDIEKCRSDGSAWDRLETCEHGCDLETKLCKSAPLIIPIEYIITGIVVIVVIIAAVALYLRKK